MAVVMSAAIMCNFYPQFITKVTRVGFPACNFKDCHRPKCSQDVGADYAQNPFFLFHFPYATALWNSDSTDLFLATALGF